MAEEKFREDLYYRLNVLPIYVPPLRERLEDLELLVNTKIKTLNIDLGKSVSKVDDSIFEAFRKYDWPGNIRELHNKLEQAMNHIDDDESTLRLEHFSKRTVENEIDIMVAGRLLQKPLFRIYLPALNRKSAQTAADRS